MSAHRRSSACPRERGQATVEFALIIPLLVLGMLAIIQVAFVVRDQVAVVHAAREAARAASVGGDAVQAARRVLADAQVDGGGGGGVGAPVTVHVRYRSRTTLPLVGPLFPDPDLEATATMRSEK